MIGIIALLISILMPALNRARAQAKQTQCLSNERQVGMGLLAFAIDHRQHVPLAGSLYLPGGGSGTPQQVSDPDQRYSSYVVDGGVPHVMPLEAALAPYLGMSQPLRTDSAADLQQDCDNGAIRRIFHCPSVDTQQRVTMIAAGSWSMELWCDYGFNEEVTGWADNGKAGGASGHSRARGNLVRAGPLPNGFPYAQVHFHCRQVKGAALVALTASSAIPAAGGHELVFDHAARAAGAAGNSPIRIEDGSITTYLYPVTAGAAPYAARADASALRVSRPWNSADVVGNLHVLSCLIVFRPAGQPAPAVSGLSLRIDQGAVVAVDGAPLSVSFKD